jgi:hypothetical protein
MRIVESAHRIDRVQAYLKKWKSLEIGGNRGHNYTPDMLAGS